MREIIVDVGLVFENPFSQMTGAKFTVLRIALIRNKRDYQRNEMIRIKVCSLLDIEDSTNKDPLSISGGQMQRVAIASVIAMKPEVLVFG